MSLDIRHIRSLGDGKEYWYVRNSGVEPMTIDLYEKVEDVPEDIRHYCDNHPGIQEVGPDFARWLGIQGKLYPNFPKCGHPSYPNANCVAEMCRHAPDADWTRCPYFRKENKNV